ncbi:aquaporin [Candidatus Saccharibacteria bacterium]|nr:aquaporin [Candidatus Saccharibacteria bacterium]
MATTKSKKTTKSSKSKSAASKTTTKKVVEVKKVVETKPVDAELEAHPMKGFFARKFDANENILTIFKSPRIYGAILGEVIGTMFLTLILLTLGVYQPLYIMFGVIAISMAVFALSGANLNPIVTVGMMATRRMSAIRGVVYLLSQVLGAWLAFLLANAFRSTVEEPADFPQMAEVADGQFWLITMIEFVGAIMIAFFFARALAYKRSTFTFSAIYGGGVCVTLLFIIVVSSTYLSLQNNFILNPAAALMYQILPAGGENFGEVFGAICSALLTYVIFPMIGGVLGFYLADFAARLSGEHHCCGSNCPVKK